jgi:hypothetical protein
MKSKDLKVGTDYAVNESNYGKPYRATVLEVNATTKVKVGFYSTKTETLKGMVKVKAVSGAFVEKGETLYVKPQHVKQLWSEYHGEQVRAGKARAAADRSEAALRKQRADQAFSLHTALVAKGAKVGLSYSYDDADQAALVAAGFKPVEHSEDFFRNNLHSALNGLSDLMENGVVNLDQMAFLFDLSTEAPRPEDSLDDYDLEDVES